MTNLPGEYTSAYLFNSTGTPVPPAGKSTTRYDFTVGVTLTDQASGESGLLSFDGRYMSHWTYRPGDDPSDPGDWRWDNEGWNFGEFWQTQTLDLGRNRYSVRAFGVGSGSFPDGELSVSVTPRATPEPGTLVLAGLGLAGLCVGRLRRWVDLS